MLVALDPWRFYFDFYRRSGRTLLLVSFLSVIQSLLVLPVAFIVRRMFDSFILEAAYGALVVAGITLLLLNAASSACSLWAHHLTLKTTKRAISRLRERLVTECYELPRSCYAAADRGSVHTTIVQDTERLDMMSNALVAMLVPAVIVSGTLLIVLVCLSWSLSLVIGATFPFLVLASRRMGKAVRRRVGAFHRSFEAFSKGVLFVVQAMDLTRVCGAEHQEIERQRAAIGDLETTSRTMAWLSAAYGSTQTMILVAANAVILVVGGLAVAAGRMTLGTLMSFYVVAAMLHRSLNSVLTALPQVIAGNESLLRLLGLDRLNEEPPYSGKRVIPFSGTIELRSVRFGYGPKQVLTDVTLAVSSGSFVALVGPNGVGKTTIVYLILGLYRPDSGQLLADGVPYDDLDLAHLRRSIGVVMQEPFIFPGTIRENICYGCPEAGEEDLEKATELALAREFIRELKDGYETPTGEQGVLLSGGQRQRLAIARALLRNPRLLILDEPTNHLDPDAIGQLLRTIQGLKESPTVLVITQNADFLESATHAYGLSHGHILSNGSSLMLNHVHDRRERGPMAEG